MHALEAAAEYLPAGQALHTPFVEKVPAGQVNLIGVPITNALVPVYDLTANTSAAVRPFLYKRISDIQPKRAVPLAPCPNSMNCINTLGILVLETTEDGAHVFDAQSTYIVMTLLWKTTQVCTQFCEILPAEETVAPFTRFAITYVVIDEVSASPDSRISSIPYAGDDWDEKES